jgi:hypothetical protein
MSERVVWVGRTILQHGNKSWMSIHIELGREWNIPKKEVISSSCLHVR